MAFRARRHALDRRVPARSLLDVASRLCGLHAQLLSSAELSLWARIEGLSPDAVERALWKDRTPVKTWAMRGTLHLLPAFDPYVIAATRQVAHLTPGPFKAHIYRAQGWTSPVLAVDGRMVGVWSHEVKGKHVEVEIEPFVKLPGMVKEAAEEEVQRLAKLQGDGALPTSPSSHRYAERARRYG